MNVMVRHMCQILGPREIPLNGEECCCLVEIVGVHSPRAGEVISEPLGDNIFIHDLLS